MHHTSHMRLAPDFAVRYDNAPPKVSWLFEGLTPLAMSCASATHELHVLLAQLSSSKAAIDCRGSRCVREAALSEI